MTDPRPPSIKSAGDPASLAADGHLSAADLFKQYARFVASFLIRMGISRADLDDVMQEVFLVAHKMGGYSPGPAKPTTFLANIAFRAATTHRRKGKVRSFVYANEELVGGAAGETADPERSTDNQQRLELLQRCLDRLDDDKRAIFVMAEIQGETVVSIASGLGIPVDTAYSRLRAARKLFREAAKSLTEGESDSLAPSMQRAST
ncbi:MAG: RNA polymerase sigma factor [Myxococcales bacterium]|nr:RNA polymerase sigma factor [Myxococcales bacterium]